MMWPLLITSVLSVAVVIERIYFLIKITVQRQPQVMESIMANVENGNIQGALLVGEGTKDFVALILIYGLKHRAQSLTNALLRASNLTLKQFNYGLPVLDTVITLAPLLGLLSTVTGMIHAFGMLGGREIDAPSVITGGIAEALIGTGFGLAIAILALIPFNYFNARLEEARHEIEDTATHLELLLNLPKSQ